LASQQTEKLEELVRQLSEQIARLGELLSYYQQRLEQVLNTDPLTGVLNRRAFFERLEEELARHRRYGRPLALLMADVDHLKAVNDAAGHQMGDRLLVQVAQLLQTHTRAVDLVGRYGGDEFVVLLPETGSAGALCVAQRLCALVAQTEFEGGTHLSLSVGAASVPPYPPDCGRLLAATDQALYAAKAAGRGCARLAQPP
jgi:diguanylate cyclase (GGDEF)-like protein